MQQARSSRPEAFGKPTFAGIESPMARQAVTLARKELSSGHRALNGVFRLREGATGMAVFTFFQDLLVSLGSRVAAFRGLAEGAETSFLEILENLVVYFGLQPVGAALHRLFLGMQPKAERHAINALLHQTTDKLQPELAPALSRKANAVRLATGVTTLTAGLLCGEYAILHLKNLMTARAFKKDRFTDVIGLSQGGIEQEDESPVIQKSRRRLADLPLAFAGVLLGGLALARSGHKSELVQQAAAFLARHGFLPGHQNGRLAIPFNLIRAYMLFSIPGYLDAARDKQERIESAIRLPIVLGYLAFGQGFLEKFLARRFFPELMSKTGPQKGTVKKLSDIEREMGEFVAREAARNPAAKLEELASAAFRQAGSQLKKRNIVSLAALAVGTLGTGTGLAFLNRALTARRFKHQQAKSTTAPAPRLALSSPPLNRHGFQTFNAQLQNNHQPAINPQPLGQSVCQRSCSHPGNLSLGPVLLSVYE